MIRSHRLAGVLIAGALLTPALAAQDSTSLAVCGTDALDPWAGSAAAFGSEQCDNFVSDLGPLATSWGTDFGIAVLAKASRSDPNFNTSIISGHSLSRTMRTGVVTGASYQLWKAPGTGINNDPSLNAAPGATTVACPTSQLGWTFAEFGTTAALEGYNGIVGGLVNLIPSAPGRLYVKRVHAANNSCDGTGDLAQFGMGSVDEDGNIMVRADGFGSGVAGSCVPNGNLIGNNMIKIGSTARNCNSVNMISGAPETLTDGGATSYIVKANLDTYNTPGIVPSSITGGLPLYVGTNFLTEYAYGDTLGSVTTTGAHLATAPDHRGNVGLSGTDVWSGFPAGTVTMLAMLAKNAADTATSSINVWGIDTAGAITGTLDLTMPLSITDNWTGFSNLTGIDPNEFTLYQSQAAFRGGNGQVAVGTDQAGNLLVAATANHPDPAVGSDWPINYVAVARVPAGGGAAAWTMAGYNDGTTGVGGTGKPIQAGAGGGAVGRMVGLLSVTGGTPQGPSISAPMIDSVGNVWFLSAVEDFDDEDFDVALLRAVYEPGPFRFQLEQVLANGDVFAGQNSTRDYAITFLGIADSNSVSSGTAFSGNMNGDAHGGMSTAGLDPVDPRTLGGLVISAGILYDADDDGSFDSCFDDVLPGNDQPYNVLLYIGHRQWEDLGNGLGGFSGVPKLVGTGIPELGETVTLALSNALPLASANLVIGLSAINAPFKGGTLVPNTDIVFFGLPTDLSGELSLSSPWTAPAVSCFLDLYFQYWISDAAGPVGFSASNAVHIDLP